MHVESPFRDTSVGDPMLEGMAGDQPLNERALSKLRWRSRRGLLENDLFIQKFFKKYESQLTVAHARGLYALMDLSDNDLLDLLLKRKEMPDTVTQEEALEVLSMLRH
jgi:antitoxin CptB